MKLCNAEYVEITCMFVVLPLESAIMMACVFIFYVMHCIASVDFKRFLTLTPTLTHLAELLETRCVSHCCFLAMPRSTTCC
jgi:hypothetical protein